MTNSKNNLAQFDVSKFLWNVQKKLINIDLSLIESSLLFAMGSMIGLKNDCWPSQETLAEFLHTSVDNVKRGIKKLSSKNLIMVIPGLPKDKRGRSKRSLNNYYVLNLPTLEMPIQCSVPPIGNDVECQFSAHSHLLAANTVQPACQPSAHSPPNIYINKKIKENNKICASDDARNICPPIFYTANEKQERPPYPSPDYESRPQINHIPSGGLVKTIVTGNRNYRPYEQPSKLFESFWEIYPRKKSKIKSIQQWNKKNLDLEAEKIIASVKSHLENEWVGKSVEHIPYASKFLEEERFNEAVEQCNDKQVHSDKKQSPHITALNNLVNHITVSRSREGDQTKH